MTRAEHNAKWGVNRHPDEVVQSHAFNEGEAAQYDPDCDACWLGREHTWAHHDLSIFTHRPAPRPRRQVEPCGCEVFDDPGDLDTPSRRRVRFCGLHVAAPAEVMRLFAFHVAHDHGARDWRMALTRSACACPSWAPTRALLSGLRSA